MIYRQVETGDLELCVGKLMEGGPASNVLQQGDIIKLEIGNNLGFFSFNSCFRNINDWDVARFHQPEVAAHLFCAAGNMVKLDINR